MSLREQVRLVLLELGAGTSVDLEELDLADAPFPPRQGRVISLDRDSRGPRLFDYQRELAERMLESVAAHESGLLSLPTGGGKTRTAAYAALDGLRRNPEARWLWLAPSIELLEQGVGTYLELWDQAHWAPDSRIAVRELGVTGAYITFQTPQALHASSGTMKAKFDVVVFDEAHQLGAPTFKAAVERSLEPGGSLIGLSATPGRAVDHETRALVDYFDGRLLTSPALGQNPVKALQDRGILSRLTFKSIGRESDSWTRVQRMQAIVKLLTAMAKRRRRTLVFMGSVAEAIALSLVLQVSGVDAEYVEGGLDDSERDARLKRFERGETQVLLNQKLLTTGYDCPAVSDLVLGYRVNSPVLFEQMVGRAVRGPLTGGSPQSRVWQFDDHLKIHGLPQSYYRYRDYDWYAV